METKFKIDENLPIEVSVALKQAGYDAVTILDQNLGGVVDHHLASLCRDENKIIITLDMGFADIRAYPPHHYPGIIVLRIKRQD